MVTDVSAILVATIHLREFCNTTIYTMHPETESLDVAKLIQKLEVLAAIILRQEIILQNSACFTIVGNKAV